MLTPCHARSRLRLIESIRRECLNHLVILSETHLRRIRQLTPAITTKLGRAGDDPITRDPRGGVITTMFGFRFSVHTKYLAFI
jgi:hypothetical protein